MYEDDREPEEEPRAGSIALRSAHVLQLALLALLATALPYFLPGLSETTRRNFGLYYVGIPVILASMVAVEWARRAGATRGERRFWVLVNGALGCWLTSWILLLVLGDAYFLPSIQFLADVLNLSYYALLLCAAMVRPDLRLWAVNGALNRLRFAVVLLLLLVMVLYFIAIPAQLGAGDYFSHDPALFTYIGFDLLLLVAFGGLWRSNRVAPWKAVYGLMALTSAAWLVLDSVEAAMWAGWIPYVYAGTPWDLAWLAPYAPLVLAAQLHVGARTEEADAAAEDELDDGDPALRPQSEGAGLLIASIAVLPMIHIAVSATAAADPATRHARDILILLTVLILGTLAVVVQRRFESLRAISADVLRNELERNRGAKARSAAAVERDHRFIARTLDSEIERALTDACFALVQLKRRGVEEGDPVVDEIGDLIVRSRRQVHDLAQILQPATGEEGLAGALQAMFSDFTRQGGVQVVLRGSAGTGFISAEVRMAILSFVREALDAIADPSQAAAAQVTLEPRDNALRVEVVEVADRETASSADRQGVSIGPGFGRMCRIVERAGGRIETAEAGSGVVAEIPL